MKAAKKQKSARLFNLSKRKREGGWIALETLGTYAVVIASMGGAMWYFMSYMDDRTAEIAGGHQKIFSEASASYVKDNYAALLTELPAGSSTVKVVSMASIQNEGYAAKNLSTTNPYGQALELRVRRGDDNNQLEALLVSTGGETLTNAKARKVAQHLKGEGGYTVKDGDICGNTPVAVDTLCGLLGVWKSPTSRFVGGGAPNPGPGRLASALFFQDGAMVSDYLYRKRVPGKPELNTMETYLQMGAGATAVEGQPCASGDPAKPILDNGAIAKTVDGLILSCQSGMWRQPGGRTLFGGTYTILYPGTNYAGGIAVGCTTINAATGSCSCESGYQAYEVGRGAYYWIAPWDTYYVGYICSKALW